MNKYTVVVKRRVNRQDIIENIQTDDIYDSLEPIQQDNSVWWAIVINNDTGAIIRAYHDCGHD